MTAHNLTTHMLACTPRVRVYLITISIRRGSDKLSIALLAALPILLCAATLGSVFQAVLSMSRALQKLGASYAAAIVFIDDAEQLSTPIQAIKMSDAIMQICEKYSDIISMRLADRHLAQAMSEIGRVLQEFTSIFSAWLLFWAMVRKFRGIRQLEAEFTDRVRTSRTSCWNE